MARRKVARYLPGRKRQQYGGMTLYHGQALQRGNGMAMRLGVTLHRGREKRIASRCKKRVKCRCTSVVAHDSAVFRLLEDVESAFQVTEPF